MTHAAAHIRKSLALAGLALCFAGDAAAQSAPVPRDSGDAPITHTRPALPSHDDLLNSGDAERVAAAIADAQDWDWISGLCGELIDPARQKLLTEPNIIQAVATRLASAPETAQPHLLTVLSRSHDREAIRAVMKLLELDQTTVRQRLAMRCLIDQTGRADLGDDPRAWRQWWSEHEWITEGAWLSRIAQWQAERALALRDRVIAAEKRSYEVHRELYALTPADQRPALLVKFLDDQFSDVRRLGLEMTARLVINATPAPPEAIERAVQLLSDRTPDVRAAAAQLLAAVGLNGRAAEISGALSSETEAIAARAMLEALALGRPAGRDMRVALRWLPNPEAGAAAARLLIAAAENAELIDPAIRNQVWEFVRDDKGRRIGALGVRLYGVLAPAADFEKLATLLDSSDRAISEAAAEALSLRPDGVDALLEGAATHQSLARFCAGAVRRWRNDAHGWAQLREISGFPEEMLETVARSLSIHHAVIAAESETSPRWALALLESIDAPSAPATLRERLTHARRVAMLNAGRFEALIRESTVDAPSGALPREVRIAMLCMERCEDAVAAGATPDEWFDAISRLGSRDADRSRRLAATMRESLGNSLSEPDLARLQTVIDGPRTDASTIEASVPPRVDEPS